MKSWKKGAVIGGICLLLTFGFVFAQAETRLSEPVEKNITKPPVLSHLSDCPSEEACQLWEEFKEKYGENWQVRWNKHTGAPEWIFGFLHNLGTGNILDEKIALNVAEDVIKDNEVLLKATSVELNFGRIQKDSTGWIVDYSQVYNSIPVYKGEIRVILTNDGELRGILNNFYPDISLSTTPTVSMDESKGIAIEAAKNFNLTTNNKIQIGKATLLVFPLNVEESINYHLVWKIPLQSNTFQWAADFFIDAHSGEIVDVKSSMSYMDDVPKQSTDERLKFLLFGLVGIVLLIGFVLILRRGLK